MKKPFTVIAAFDSFKESMTSLEAGRAFAKGFRAILPRARVKVVSVSDGGEGFTEAFLAGEGREIPVQVRGPLGKPITACFGLFDNGRKAVVEMARASGLELLKPAKRNPWRTTTFGTGQLIDAAVKKGAKEIIIGIGGSATNDGGLGMAQALGAQFTGLDGKVLPAPLAGGDLPRVAHVRLEGLRKRLKGVKISVACDVKNPMTGKNGAAFIFGPQKGASPAMVRQLDQGLKNLCAIIRRDIGRDVEKVQGAGAAGGLGGGLLAFLDARLAPGIRLVLDNIGFKKLLSCADLVVTGEGRMDGQSLNNKAPIGVALMAKKAGLPVIALCGSLGKEAEAATAYGVTAAFSIVPGVMDLKTALETGKENLERTGRALARLIRNKTC